MCVVVLRPALRHGKHVAPTYQRRDTHWNDFGAWLAYCEIMSAAQPYVPSVQPLSPDQFSLVVRRRPGGDLAKMLALQGVLTEQNVELEFRRVLDLPKERVWQYGFDPVPLGDGPDQPRMVLFRDSFASFFLPYRAEHFAGVGLWPYGFDDGVVRRQRPAVVLDELVERRLMSAPPVNPPELRRRPE